MSTCRRPGLGTARTRPGRGKVTHAAADPWWGANALDGVLLTFAGIFLHANPWVIIAETILGNGDQAFEYYSEINPATKNDVIEQYECEPYFYAQNILGDEHPLFGTARNSWLTGTASWAYQAATQYILGVRPIYEGLLIDPCIPSSWDGFQVTREFRKTVYRIEIKNPHHVCKGVRSVKVDGQEIEGNVVPVFGDGGTHPVEVTM